MFVVILKILVTSKMVTWPLRRPIGDTIISLYSSCKVWRTRKKSATHLIRPIFNFWISLPMFIWLINYESFLWKWDLIVSLYPFRIISQITNVCLFLFHCSNTSFHLQSTPAMLIFGPLSRYRGWTTYDCNNFCNFMIVSNKIAMMMTMGTKYECNLYKNGDYIWLQSLSKRTKYDCNVGILMKIIFRCLQSYLVPFERDCIHI